jgi:hypothetical protein
MFFALHGQPRLVFSFFFVAHELLQLQFVTCIKYNNCLVFSAIYNVNICTFLIILIALVDASITSYDMKPNVSDVFRICNVMRRTGCAVGDTAALRTLDNDKAHGPDGIPARLLTGIVYLIAPSLCDLFNKSLRTGVVPRDWKLANVVPVFKKGDKDMFKITDQYLCCL